MKTLIAVVAVLAAITTSAAARNDNFWPGTSKSYCTVADPTGTPLNVRKAPNGAIVGALHNDTTVLVKEIALANGKQWARIVPATGRNGWVFFDHLECDD